MPITDTNFIEQMRAKQNEKFAELMKNIDNKDEAPGRELAVVILAAGLGKRMKSPDKPKVMFELNGKPMIQFVIELALNVNAQRIIPIVGNHRQQVIDFVDNLIPNLPFADEKGAKAVIEYAIQEKQLGTGHAIMQTEEPLKDFTGNVLILSGDVPLLKFETVERLINEHQDNDFDATLLTTVFKDATGYGRIVRDSEGMFLKIVEHKDATEEEKKINEINPAIYIAKSNVLFDALHKVTPDNNQNEYYLTDIFHFIAKEKIGTVVTEDEMEVTGINSIEQLTEMEKYLNNFQSKLK